MNRISRFAVLSQLLGGFFVTVVIFGFLWTNIGGSGGLTLAFAVVCIATLVFARRKGDAVLAALFSVHRVLPAVSPWGWFLGIVVLGITLRVFVITVYPAT